jgi:glycosyltransferase involved in cell wall biosynthesis
LTKLSAVIIAKNESAVIERCLKSLDGVDEIIVVDTGSDDNTVEIAKKHAKVYTDYTWNDDFSEARNYALSKSTGDWNISIDCDEYLPEGMISIIRDSIPQDNSVDSLGVKLVWHTNPDGSYHTVPRIIRRGVRFQGKIHETVVASRAYSDVWWYISRSPAHDLDPHRNLRILLSDHSSTRSKFYLAQTYMEVYGDWPNAIFWYDKYMKESTFNAEYAEALLAKAKCLWNLSRGAEARNSCLYAILRNPNFKEAFIQMSRMVWPEQAEAWRKHAEIATNEGVLFVRQ